MNKANSFVLLFFELEAAKSNLRVKIWRRLQKLGSVAVKGSAYALPNTPEHEELFVWIAKEISTGGGSAEVYIGHPASTEGLSTLCERFKNASDERYTRIVEECVRVAAELSSDKIAEVATLKTIEKLQRSLNDAKLLDFFGSPKGTDAGVAVERVAAVIFSRENGTMGKTEVIKPRRKRDFRGRRWVTRADIFADRLACAWLVLRFIDPKAQIVFIDTAEPDTKRNDDVTFDMESGDITHEGNLCSFEVMIESFGFSEDSALVRLSKIIHDIDLEDELYDLSETPGIEIVIRSLRKETRNDAVFLKNGRALLDTVYNGYKSTQTK